MQYIKHQRVSLKESNEFDEKWVQNKICEDPTIIGLGDLAVRDKERRQPRAGRLDLLLEDPESKRRYEIELQLGKTDESHIIRTIEYWDHERKLYPQYEHCAVIIAEDITSRFFNVISLFNGTIPLIAIKMSALKIEDKLCLNFTTILDEFRRGYVEEEDEIAKPASRADWETWATPTTVSLADKMLELVRKIEPGMELKFNKYYIGLSNKNKPDNFAVFRPKKSLLSFEPRIEPSQETDSLIKTAGLEMLSYDKTWGRYRIQLTAQDIDKNRDILIKLLQLAHDE